MSKHVCPANRKKKNCFADATVSFCSSLYISGCFFFLLCQQAVTIISSHQYFTLSHSLCISKAGFLYGIAGSSKDCFLLRNSEPFSKYTSNAFRRLVNLSYLARKNKLSVHHKSNLLAGETEVEAIKVQKKKIFHSCICQYC